VKRFIEPPVFFGAARTVAFIGAGLLVSLAVTGIYLPLGPSVPVAFVLAVIGLALTLGSPWHGLVMTICALTLLPLPFSIRAGPITLSFGRFLTFALVVGWLAQQRRPQRPYRAPRTPIGGPLLLLIGALLASTIWNLPRFIPLEFSGAIRRIALYVIEYALLTAITISVVRTHERLRRLTEIVTGLIVLTALFGLFEIVTGQNIFQFLSPLLPGGFGQFIRDIAQASVLTRGSITRVRSTFEQPLAFASVLLMGLPLALSLASSAVTQRSRRFWTAGTLLIGMSILYTASRSAYAIATVVVLLMMFLLPRDTGRRLVAASAGAVVVLFLLQPSVRDTMLQFINPTTANGVIEGSLNSRLTDYEPVLDKVADRPVFGYGPRSFFVDELVASNLLTDRAIVLDNAYLLALVETGIVGLTALVYVLVTAATSAFRASRRALDQDVGIIAGGLFAAVVSWILMGFAADVYVFNAPPRLFFVVLGLVGAARRLSGWPDDRTSTSRTPAASQHVHQG
jgi:hypothetical protein